MIRRTIVWLANTWLRTRPVKRRAKSLIIVKLDHIGDYVLFRSFLEQIRNSKKFRGYEISLLGNIAWRDLSMELDKNLVDHFFWIDRSQFVSSFKYRFSQLAQLQRYEIMINPTYSRTYELDDEAARLIRADVKIASEADLSNVTREQAALGNKCYDQLIRADEGIKFEFYRNCDFFGRLLESPLSLEKPEISLTKNAQAGQPYVVVFPGGTYASKLWSAASYSVIINTIVEELNYDLYVCGGHADRRLVQDAIPNAGDRVRDMVGKTSLTELVNIINGSALLISNETSAVHIANALGKPYVCVADGVNLKRFSPYPREIASGVHIFPREIQDNIHEIDKLADDYKRGALHAAKRNADINTVAPGDVMNIVRKLLPSAKRSK